MELCLTITGRCCDLALHPVSYSTAEKVREEGRGIYKTKYLEWWRKGNTCTCGMKLDDRSVVEVTLDGKQVPFAPKGIKDAAVLLRRRMYLDSKARFLALMGYVDEVCSLTWRWENVSGFDPQKFEFFVHRWDRLMNVNGFYLVDDARYDGRFATENIWGERGGHSMIDPVVIDLEDVRQEILGGKVRVA
ncbi:MAG: hypothetical protein AUJ49_09255 [Desulfovibrionaceae bacterium CG1_02_65_16]|nr:MAG: hypothetical protein AUJ49_09255 [Desulfovibrionaceae bacterium CG1_02_65_16]